MENDLLFTKDELEKCLADISSSADICRIFGAYDMAENAYLNRYRRSGAPHFFHISRICRIIVKELKISEPDLIAASMLQDILVIGCGINQEVIEYNFGSYVSYLIESLTNENIRQKQREFTLENISELGGPDGLILRLAKSLDNLRYLDFEFSDNPISYLNSIMTKYFKLSIQTDNPHVRHLIAEIRKESNKLIG